MNFVKCIQIFDTYYFFVAVFMFAGLFLFALINLVANPYRKQNAAFKRAIGSMLGNVNRQFDGFENLPDEYRRQWRAYLSGHADKPSDVMEFVPIKCKLRFLLLFVVCTLCAAVFLVVFAIDLTGTSYMLAALVYFSLTAHCFVAVKYAQSVKRRNAKRLFAKFAALLNRHSSEIDVNMSQKLSQLKDISNNLPCDEASERAANVLRDMGLSAKRTVEEQRKINTAVNGLLQAYARSVRN